MRQTSPVPEGIAVVVCCCEKDTVTCSLFQTDELSSRLRVCLRSVSGKKESRGPKLSEQILYKKLFNTQECLDKTIFLTEMAIW